MFRSFLLWLNGCLISLALLMGIYHLSETLYHNPAPARPSYNISGKELPPLQAVPSDPIKMAQNDDTLDGARLFRQCASCHTVSEQGPNRVGPSLWNVIDRPVASLDNYRYSRALQLLGKQGAIWDEVRLDAYITAPAQAVMGTSMAFRGLTEAQARAAIITYLRTLGPDKGAQERKASD